MLRSYPLRFIFPALMALVVTVSSGPLFPRTSDSSEKPADGGPHATSPYQTGAAPRIDGELDDEAWQVPPLNKDFITYNPRYGDILPQKTLVWSAYDSEALYFAFRCLDEEPNRIKTSLTRRDGMFSDDWVGLKLDALGTRQTSYDLFCNPDGIQGDILTSAVSGEDTAPDFVWDSAGRLTEEGYQIEIRIPLRSIRFKCRDITRMRVLFWRRISRLGLSGSWPAIDPGKGIFNVTASADYRGLKAPLNLEILPSAIAGRDSRLVSPGTWSGADVFQDLGIGLKYGISSSVTADLTLNPDFSQVESDTFQVEINRRYPNFYTEKRPFFMEGSDIFSFFVAPYGYISSSVHTRNIVDPQWGAKLTGTLGGTAFGLLSAGDEFPGRAGEEENNPYQGKKAYFTVARAKHSLGGDNYLGGIFSGREFAGGFNRVAGMDTGFRLFTRHQFNLSVLQSHTRNPGVADTAVKRDFNFLYAYHTRPLGVMAAFEHIDRDFHMESAFLQRTGIDEGWIWIGPNFYPDESKTPWLRRIHPHFTAQLLRDNFTGRYDSFLRATLEFSFTRQGRLQLAAIMSQENWKRETFRLGEAAIEGNVQLTNWLYLWSGLTIQQSIYYPADPPFKGDVIQGGLRIVLQPTPSLNQSFSFYRVDFDYPDGGNVYTVDLLYSRTTYQFNKYFFLRGIVQYDSSIKTLLTDFLASFTLIPGTVIHAGYGGLFEEGRWVEERWMPGAGNLTGVRRSFFFKASYLLRF